MTYNIPCFVISIFILSSLVLLNGYRQSRVSHGRFTKKRLDSNKLSIPPATFIECSQQAAIAVRKLIEVGDKLIEVDFPPLPLEYLEDSTSSARDIADANTRWAIEFARNIADMGQVSIIYPDQPELDDGIKFVDMPGKTKPFTNITLATTRSDSIKNAKSIDQILMSIFGATVGGTVEAIPGTKLYLAVTSSTQELLDLEKLHNLDPTIPIVFFNLKIDQLRGDLGLPLFPNRDFHYNFLTRIRSAFVMRSRAFATTLRRPPFILNYSGLLYRNYPEPFQCILNTGNGKSKLVKVLEYRPSSGEYRDSLIEALQVPNVPREELRTKANDPWWEKVSLKENSSAWRE